MEEFILCCYLVGCICKICYSIFFFPYKNVEWLNVDLSYRNQSIDFLWLLRKSIDWFLYNRDPRHKRNKNHFKVILIISDFYLQTITCFFTLVQSRYAIVWNTRFNHQDHLDFVKYLINVYLLKKVYIYLLKRFYINS